jgi:hypothetical protein
VSLPNRKSVAVPAKQQLVPYPTCRVNLLWPGRTVSSLRNVGRFPALAMWTGVSSEGGQLQHTTGHALIDGYIDELLLFPHYRPNVVEMLGCHVGTTRQ